MSRRLTTEKFIEKAKKVHGERYDYSKVEYVNTNTNVTIICREHEPFPQTPHNHLQGKGCNKCGVIERSLSQASTTEEFIQKAKAVHGNRYDYSSVNYVDARTHVMIICPDHGPFPQRPTNHLDGHGCDECKKIALSLLKTSTTKEFIEKSKAVHGDRYDYSSVSYVNNSTKVMIICREHEPFPQTPDNHLQGKGCRICGDIAQALNQSSTTEEFIEKAKAVHGDRYDYSQVEYVGNKTDVTIICREHEPFPQTPSKHLLGHGCGFCAGNMPLTTEIFIERAKAVHGNRYGYSEVEYVNTNTDVTINCPDHGLFDQRPDHHLSGSGCLDCADTGFNPSERGLLYYVAVTTDDGDTRYKIGITNYTVEERFRAPDLARIRTVKTWRYAIGRAAAEREAEILKQYAGDRYYGPDILVGAGNTELFTHDILGLDA